MRGGVIFFRMNIIVFPTHYSSYGSPHEGERIQKVIPKHNDLISKLNQNHLYPLLSTKPPPCDQNDLPNKNGLIILVEGEEDFYNGFKTRNDVIAIKDWNGEKPFGVIFYNFEVDEKKLARVAEIIYDCLFFDINIYDLIATRSLTTLYNEKYLKGSEIIKPEIQSDTWTGTKIIGNDEVSFHPKTYSEEANKFFLK